MKESLYQVPALERGLAVLEYLAEHPEGKTQGELAEILKCPVASLFRMMLCLEQQKYVARDPKTKVFRLTSRMLSIGQRAVCELDLVGTALPVMRRLRDNLQDTIVLGVLSDGEVIVIESALGTHLFRFAVTMGHRTVPHASAPGKAIIAFLPEPEQSRTIEGLSFKKYNRNTITSPRAFRKALDKIRKDGYAVDQGEEYAGIYCLGAPIFDRNGFPVAAIWITGPDTRVPPSDYPRIGQELREGALEISARLGFTIPSS